MKEQIIKESIESLRREGLRFSVDTLAERLNISKKTIYKYFPNKESLARALYQRYYADAKIQIGKLIAEKSDSAQASLLYLYFDAKSITRGDIFNKYKLNEALYTYTVEQNDALWDALSASFGDDISKEEKQVLHILVDGAFEKLCNEKIAPDGVIDRLVKLLW